MSNEDKKNALEWFRWLLNASTAVGAFFLVQTYTTLKEMNEMMHHHLRESSRYEERLNQHDRELDRHEKAIEQLHRHATYTSPR